jgi:DNA relaxase NicK
LGWLSGVTWGDGPGLADAFATYLGEVTIRDTGTRWYASAAELGDKGSMVAWGPRGRDSKADEVMFSVPQSALDVLGLTRALQLVTELRLVGVRLSRVDVYLDDLARRADPRSVMDAYQAGDCVTHFQSWDWIENSDGGATAYLGSRQSDAYIRVYRKWAESGDPEQGVRWELQTRASKAQALAAVVVTDADPAGAFLGALRGLVDFRACAGMAQKLRAPMLPWWAALVEDAGRLRLSTPQPGTSLAEKMEWLHRQVAPTMGLMDAAEKGGWLDAGWMDRLVAHGAERLTARHLALLDGAS